MSLKNGQSRTRRTAAKPGCEVFDPDAFWGHTLTGPATSDQPDAFDARVERAWRFMRTMFFTPEEHAAMAEAVVRLCVIHEQNQE
ncbi:MAG: hypothetical protein WCQ77_13200 [Planctomycetota bacterium]